jgi:hypothetical protein
MITGLAMPTAFGGGGDAIFFGRGGLRKSQNAHETEQHGEKYLYPISPIRRTTAPQNHHDDLQFLRACN